MPGSLPRSSIGIRKVGVEVEPSPGFFEMVVVAAR